MARYCPLFSGSGGNCTYIASPSGGVLIDAGVSAKRIETALTEREIDPRSIEAIFVTHEHTDHIAGLRVLQKRYGYAVYASYGTLDWLCENDKLYADAPACIMPDEGVAVGSLFVRGFHTPHDSRESLGFVVETPDERRLAVATDMGYMTDTVRQTLHGCDLVHIESNHDLQMLRCGDYPAMLKRRILGRGGHLSNVDCAKTLPELVQSGTTWLTLAHLSRENNTPQTAYDTAADSMTQAGMKSGGDYRLTVAQPMCDRPVTII